MEEGVETGKKKNCSGGGGGNRQTNTPAGSATQGDTFWNGSSYVARAARHLVL